MLMLLYKQYATRTNDSLFQYAYINNKPFESSLYLMILKTSGMSFLTSMCLAVYLGSAKEIPA